MNMRLNFEGLRRKLQLMNSASVYFTQIHKDAAAFLQEKIVDEVISGQYVGFKSGYLIRSVSLFPIQDVKTLIASNLTIAPYAVYVLAWSQQKYGRNYLQIALDIWGGEVRNKMAQEYSRMITAVQNRTSYTYQNPF